MQLLFGRSKLLACCLLLAGVPLPVSAQSQCAGFLASATANPFPALRESRDPNLQNALQRRLQEMGYAKPIQRGQLDVTVVDITDAYQPRLAAVNGDVMMYAASLPKIAILLGAYQRAHEGTLVIDSKTREELVAMIRHSSNRSATRMLNVVGKEYLADLLQSERYKLYDPDFDGGLWVGKEYAKAGAWQRDPLHNISHGATSNQVARFFYLLHTGRLVSPESSLEMKKILGNPGLNHKFVRGLSEHRPGSRVYRKSGTWQTYHSDGAIVERDGRCYIAVVLANHPDAKSWPRKIIVALDELVFQQTQRRRTAAVTSVDSPTVAALSSAPTAAP